MAQSDARCLPFDEDRFDIVDLSDVIEHCEDDGIILKEAERVVKGSKIILVKVPSREELWS